MTSERPDWLIVERRDAPLIVSIPHAGTDLLTFEPAFVSPWLARKDADWRLDELYDFVAPLGATVVRTRLSRSIIDVNRDPSGASLYPGQATTELVPTTTFDGEPLYRPGLRARRSRHCRPATSLLRSLPRGARRRDCSPAPEASSASLSSTPIPFGQSFRACSRANCRCSISARIPARAATPDCARRSAPCWPRAGKRPSSTGASRAAGSRAPMGARAKASRLLQLELACRAYMHEPERPAPDNWPTPIDEKRAAPTRATIKRVLEAILSEVSG